MINFRFHVLSLFAIFAAVLLGLVVGAVVVSAQTAPAGAPEPVGAIRGNPDLASAISAVDNVGTPHGRLVVAWAVADQLAGTVGHYGAGATLVPGTGS
jgi:hypothetical protein